MHFDYTVLEFDLKKKASKELEAIQIQLEQRFLFSPLQQVLCVMASQRLSLFLRVEGGNECTSFCRSYHHPASWGLVFFSSSVCFLLLCIFFLILSCSEQSAARLLVRAVGQSLGIAAVCSALCSLKLLPIEEKGALHVCVTIATPLSWEWRGSSGGEWGGSWLQRSPHPGKAAAALPKVSQVHVGDHQRAELSHDSLLQELRQHLTNSLVTASLTRFSQCMSRIKLRLYQPHSEHSDVSPLFW